MLLDVLRARLLLGLVRRTTTTAAVRRHVHMAGIDSLDTLLEEELKDTYDAEKQLTKALPKLAKKATAEELKTAFEQHLRQTEQHIERLEQVFESLELPVKGKKCEGMRNLIKEGDDMIAE